MWVKAAGSVCVVGGGLRVGEQSKCLYFNFLYPFWENGTSVNNNVGKKPPEGRKFKKDRGGGGQGWVGVGYWVRAGE